MSSKDDEGFAAARAAQHAFEKAGGSGPTGPLFQFVAREVVEGMRAQYEAGSSISLFAAMRQCASHGIPMPKWVAKAFIRGYDRVLNCDSASWDESFGLPYGTYKKSQLVGMKRRRNIEFAAYYAVCEMHKNGRPIDVKTFAAVAKPLKSNSTEIGKLYYSAKRRITRTRPKHT